MILLALALATLTTSAPLTDKDGDGRITLTKPLAPFKKGDTLTLCADQPRWTYAVVCPVKAPADDPWAIRGPLIPFRGRNYWLNIYPAKPVEGKVIERMSIESGETAIKFGRASTSGTVRDTIIRNVSPATKCSEIDTGIAIGGSKGGVATTGILIERVKVSGFKMDTTLTCYLNGDGLVANRGTGIITVRYSEFSDNADAGIDTKADLTVIENVRVIDNGHYGARFWNKAVVTGLLCQNNAWGCLEGEAGADVTVSGLKMVGPEELVTTKKGATLTFTDCPDLSEWTGTLLLKGQGKVVFPVGCKLP